MEYDCGTRACTGVITPPLSITAVSQARFFCARVVDSPRAWGSPISRGGATTPTNEARAFYGLLQNSSSPTPPRPSVSTRVPETPAHCVAARALETRFAAPTPTRMAPDAFCAPNSPVVTSVQLSVRCSFFNYVHTPTPQYKAVLSEFYLFVDYYPFLSARACLT